MGFDWRTFALQAANFAVLVWLLHRFLYRPLLAVIAARKAQIAKEYEQSAAVSADAQAQLASATAERNRITAERDSILKAAAAQAEQTGAAQRAEASLQATALLDDARKRLAAERAAALAEARRIAVDLAADMAGRLIREIPAELRAQAWLERVERHLSTAPAPERADLMLGISAHNPMRIVSATALPETSQALWRTRLQHALGTQAPIEFASDPDLVAGVELHFPGAILRLTWQASLESLRSELASPESSIHVDPR